MLEIFIILIIVLLFASVLNAMEESARQEHQRFLKELKQELSGDRQCPPHRWSYHPQTHRLTCTTCGYVSGT